MVVKIFVIFVINIHSTNKNNLRIRRKDSS